MHLTCHNLRFRTMQFLPSTTRSKYASKIGCQLDALLAHWSPIKLKFL